jgi:hypothetical protein
MKTTLLPLLALSSAVLAAPLPGPDTPTGGVSLPSFHILSTIIPHTLPLLPEDEVLILCSYSMEITELILSQLMGMDRMETIPIPLLQVE